jgi:hypothetical protein
MGGIADQMRSLRTGPGREPSEPRRAPARHDTIEFELREDDYSWGLTLTAAVIGLGASYWKVRVVGRVHRANGDWEEVDFGHFLKMASRALELLEGYDRMNGAEHLRKCRDLLIRDGWEELPRGQWWYSLRFRRPA